MSAAVMDTIRSEMMQRRTRQVERLCTASAFTLVALTLDAGLLGISQSEKAAEALMK